MSYFGLTVNDYCILLDATRTKGYIPDQTKLEALKTKYPKLNNHDAIIVLKLINSPIRNSFTVYDVFSELEKNYK